MYDLIDEELTHIETVIRRWRAEIELSEVLPPSYWRAKLHTLISTSHLSRSQFQRADSALALLGSYNPTDPPANERIVETGIAAPGSEATAQCSR